MPPENVPVHVEYIILRNVMASSMEAELGGLFENFQKATSTRMALVEMGHPQAPTPMANYNAAANIIVNGTQKQKYPKQ